MSARILVLGAGFAGLELSATLSEELGDEASVTLIDAGDAFVFGYSKLDVMFGQTTLEAVRHPYRDIEMPGVRFVQERITAIDPEARRVTTNAGVHEGDFLVVALGADYDLEATPGLAEANEFYSVAGAERLGELLPSFSQGRAVVGVCGAPFKCPPAPSEAALLLHEYLTSRGVRDACEISLVMPFGSPIPPSPEASSALLQAFDERDITWVPQRRPTSLDSSRGVITLDDGSEMACDLFLGVPKHRAPQVVLGSGLTDDTYIPVNLRNLETRFPDVYAAGDVVTFGQTVPMAGVFAEGQARVAAEALIARIRGGEEPSPYVGRASCYIEFGGGLVGAAEVDFLSGPKPTGSFREPSEALVAEKREFGASRIARWFSRGTPP